MAPNHRNDAIWELIRKSPADEYRKDMATQALEHVEKLGNGAAGDNATQGRALCHFGRMLTMMFLEDRVTQTDCLAAHRRLKQEIADDKTYEQITQCPIHIPDSSISNTIMPHQ